MKETSLGWAPAIPSHWEVVPLSAVARMGTGHTPDRNKAEYWENCTIPWVTTPDVTKRGGTLAPLTDTEQKISELGLANSAAVLHPANTIMLSRTASVGYSVRIGRPMATTQAFVTWNAGPRLEPRYLLLVLRAMKQEWERLANGSTHLTIYMPDLESLRIPLPPLEEQRRIADFLDAETTRIDKLAELRAAVLDRLAEREAAEVDAALDELSDKFGYAPLRRFLLGVDQGSSPQCDAVPAADDEWGVLKVSCLRPGRFNPRENKRLPEGEVASVTHEVREGDLLVTRANTPQLVGSTAVVPRVRRRLLLSDKIFRVHLDDRFSPEFVAVVARGKRIRDICAAVSNGASQSMANIRFEEVKAWPLPLADLATQADVVARVTMQTRWVESIRQCVERQTKLLSERRQALITAAVTGEFDVSAASGRGIEE